MDPITGTPNDAQHARMLLHAAASAIALAGQNDVVQLDLDDVDRQPSPGAQRTMVSERLAQAMGQVDRVIRSQTEAPPVSAATLGRRLVSRGEVLDLRAGTYRPGPGLATLIETALLDAAVAIEEQR